MAEHSYLVGKTVTLSCALADNNTPANNPVTGETVTVSLRRFSDDKWWDFVAGEWDVVAFASLAAQHKQALTDKGDGSYEVDWDQATNDASAERQYLAYYKVTSAGDFLNRVTTDVLTFAAVAQAVDTLLSNTHGAEQWGGAAGTGANTVTVTVRTAGGVVYQGVKVSAGNQAETNTPLVLYTNASGQAVFYCEAAAWRFVAAATGAQSGGATNVTVDGAESVTITVTAVALPSPAPAGYCAVRAVVERRTDTAEAGTFTFVKGRLPLTRSSGGATVILLDAEEDATLVDGEATLNILQGATVTLRLTAQGDVKEAEVVVPAASNADWDGGTTLTETV